MYDQLDRIKTCELATGLRIPLIDSYYPDKSYILCVYIDDSGEMPTASELNLLRSYLDYQLSLPRPISVTAMARAPFDTDPGVNTLILLKRGSKDWRYRKLTWEPLIPWWPYEPAPELFDLKGLLDNYERQSERWLQWQAAHPA